MTRGTFANIRLKNKLAPGTEGGHSVYLPTGEPGYLYDVAERYKADGTPPSRHRRLGLRHGLVEGLGRERARSCSASRPSS